MLWGWQGAEASSSSGSRLPAAVYKDWTEWKARYLSSIMDDLAAVLFDNRRGTCHCLMLNYWIRCGGLQAFLAQFGTAAQFLWDVTAEEAAEEKASPTPGQSQTVGVPCSLPLTHAPGTMHLEFQDQQGHGGTHIARKCAICCQSPCRQAFPDDHTCKFTCTCREIGDGAVRLTG